MKFSLKEKRIYIFIFSLTCFLVLFTLYQSFSPASQSGLRKLIDQKKVNNRCSKAYKEFKEKYTESPSNYEIENVTLDDYQKSLKEIIEDNEYKKIKKYLPRILVYVIIAFLDIIFIILWIVFCCYACRNMEKQNRIGCGSKCCFILFFILCVGVILLSVIGIIYTPYLNKSFSAFVCSLDKLVFNFLEGINDGNEELRWMGLYNMTDDLTKLNKETYKEPIEKINTMISIFEDINNKTLDDLEDSLKKFEDLYPYNSIILFGGVAIFNLLGLLAMFLIFVCECKCMSCLFHLFWNIEIIFIIVTFGLTSIIGSFSVASKDISEILIYKAKNIIDDDKVFLVNFTEITEEINICLNEQGDLFSYIFEGLEEKYYKDNNEDLRSSYNCSFLKMDYKILANELKDSISKKLYFISLLFIIVDIAGMVSIFFGITIYNSQKAYYPPTEVNVNVNNRLPNNRADLSTENLKKQSNEVIFSKK